MQSAAMESLHPQSVNTLRVCTVIGKDGKVKILSAILRTGRGDMHIDNGGAGGILSGVDKSTGMVITDGMDEAHCEYAVHPDTNIRFQGFQIPAWDDLIALVEEMQLLIPKHRCTAWDMAHTDDGWVLVEANDQGQFSVLQIAHRKGYKSELESLM